MRSVKNAVTGAFAALGGAALFREVIRSTIESENALRQLEQRLLSTGGVAQRTAQQLTGYASELQRASTFDDEAIIRAQTSLLSFTNIAGDVFDRTTRAALDLAVALDQDLPSAAKTLGIALNDPEKGISRLTRAGIQLDEAQANLVKRLADTGHIVEAQNVLLGELERRYGGAATAAADTFGGALTQVKNAFNDLFEAPGGLVDTKIALQELTDLLQDPETVAAANTLTSALITGFGKAVEAITSFANIGKGIGIFAGQLMTGTTNPEDQLEVLTAAIKRNAAELKAANAQSETFFGRLGLWVDEDRIKLLEQEAVALQEVLRIYQTKPDTFFQTGGGGSTATPAGARTKPVTPGIPPSEEFDKLRGQLEQQIALFGQSGEAAKIAYQIQSGALDELSGKERQHIQLLADQYEALVQGSDIAKGIAEQEKKDAEDAAKVKEQFAGQLESVRQFTLTRTEVELEAHAERLEILRESLEQGLLIEQEFNSLSIESAAETQRRITEILKQEASSRSNAFTEAAGQILDQTLSLTSQLAAHDKQAFNLHKTAAIASALLNTYEGITKTLAKYPGPVGIALSALTAAAGFVQVRAIKATSFGGGAVSAGVTSAGGMPSISTPSGSVSSQEGSSREKVVQIHFNGDFNGWDNYVRDKVISSIRESVDDHDVIIFGRDSRQAAILAGT